MSAEVSIPPTAADCASCGACCREAYHVVEIDEDDPFLEAHSGLVTMPDGRAVLERPGGLCVALCSSQNGEYHCSIYPTRPRNCRDFEVGGENCLDARKRVGL